MFEMKLVGDDAQMIVGVVNQGIDAHLEDFTKSTFGWYYHTTDDEEVPYHKTADKSIVSRIVVCKLHCQIANEEMSILLRRLTEMDDEGNLEAGQLADDIVQVEWDLESRDV